MPHPEHERRNPRIGLFMVGLYLHANFSSDATPFM